MNNIDQERAGSSNPITCILFDLDGTLRHNCPSSVQVLYDYAVRLGIEDKPERWLRIMRWTHYYWAQSPEYTKDIQTYGEMNEHFWNNYARRALGILDCNDGCAEELGPEIHRYMDEEHSPGDCIPEDIQPTLQRLKSAGYRLGILSNREEPINEHVEKIGLEEYFHLVMVAGEVNAWKPDPIIFHHAMKRIGTTPDQTLYVGDNYYADVIGARNAGMIPVLIDPDRLFPEADCLVIRNIGDLLGILDSPDLIAQYHLEHSLFTPN